MTKIQIEGRALYQWDTDRHVIITPGVDTTVKEVHFASAGRDEALVIERTGGQFTARIPDELLETSANLKVYTVTETEDGERTEAAYIFGVIARPKPADHACKEKLDANMGSDNAGRVLVVGEDGGVHPQTDAETIALLIETDTLPAVKNADGKLLSMGNKIIMRH